MLENIKKNLGLILITNILIMFVISYKYGCDSILSIGLSVGVVYLWFIYSISTAILILMIVNDKLFIHFYYEFIKVNGGVKLTIRSIINITILMLLSLILCLSDIYNLAILLIINIILELYTRYRYFKFSKAQKDV